MRFFIDNDFWKLNKILLPQGFIFCDYLQEMQILELEEYIVKKDDEGSTNFEYFTTKLGRFKNVEDILNIDFSCTYLDQGSKFHLMRNIFKLFNIKNVSNKFLKKFVLNLDQSFYLKRIEFLLYERKFTKFLNASEDK